MINKRKRKQLLPITLMLILCISIGYAFLSSALNINGQASIKGNNFDVHFENIKVSDDSVDVGAENEAKITNPTEVTFKAVLNAPGDKYEFTVDVVNSGTVDAMIGDLDDIVLTENQQKVLDYSITYKDGLPVNPMDGIKASKKLPIKILVSYKTDVTADDIKNVDEATPVAITQAVNYIQADERANFIVSDYSNFIMKNIGAKHNDEEFAELKSYYSKLSTVVLNDSINIPDGVSSWDISESGNNSVIAYILPNADDFLKYDLYIEGNGALFAPSDCVYFFSFFGDEGSVVYSEIKGLDKLDTSNVEDMSYMFSGCDNLEKIDLSNFSTSKVIDMSAMFGSCSNLTSLNLSVFNTSNVKNMHEMFFYCSSLTSLDLSNFDTSQVTDMFGMFSDCSNLTSLNLKIFDTSKVKEMSSMFSDCRSLTSLDLSNFDTSQVASMSCMFSWCTSLTSLDLSNFDTSKVTNMYEMFYVCSKLKNINLSNFNTSNVKDMTDMFSNCSCLTYLDFRKASFGTITSYSNMFSSVPSGINIIVKDESAKTWILNKKSDAVVKTVAEL